jgi:hypothetical protein
MTTDTADVELEIRIEARFVLWALRCCAHRGETSVQVAALEVARGFELADAAETLDRFWRFAQALCDAVDSPQVWHHPACDCVSPEEMSVLTALCFAAVAPAHVPMAARPQAPWEVLVAEDHALLVHALASQWLHALRRAGICYPLPGELVREGSSQLYAGLPVPPQRH